MIAQACPTGIAAVRAKRGAGVIWPSPKQDPDRTHDADTSQGSRPHDQGAHFAQTGDEAVTVLITGFGPTDTVYENPADDPAAKH